MPSAMNLPGEDVVIRMPQTEASFGLTRPAVEQSKMDSFSVKNERDEAGGRPDVAADVPPIEEVPRRSTLKRELEDMDGCNCIEKMKVPSTALHLLDCHKLPVEERQIILSGLAREVRLTRRAIEASKNLSEAASALANVKLCAEAAVGSVVKTMSILENISEELHLRRDAHLQRNTVRTSPVSYV